MVTLGQSAGLPTLLPHLYELKDEEDEQHIPGLAQHSPSASSTLGLSNFQHQRWGFSI